MQRIKYFAYYDLIPSADKRNIVLSAVNKIDYVIECINANGIGVDMVSFAGLTGNNWAFSKGSVIRRGMNTFRNFASVSSPRIFNPFFRWILTLRFIVYLLFNCRNREKIIVYHSLGYDAIFNFVNRFKHFVIIGEIEEIYQDVANSFSKADKRNEYRFIDNCSAYIFPSKLLEKKLNKDNKPYVVVHGTYHVAKERCARFGDGRIHVVYAGTFDPNKGGAQMAVEAARFLPDTYHVHIVGWGGEADVANLKSRIDEITRNGGSTVTYDGLLTGKEFEEFLQKCHIGLSTQNPTDVFNDTSFPSKVLTYMGNGLDVVTFKIDVLTTSSLDPFMHYPADYSAQALADTIKSISGSASISNRAADALQQLDEEFRTAIGRLLSE